MNHTYILFADSSYMQPVHNIGHIQLILAYRVTTINP